MVEKQLASVVSFDIVTDPQSLILTPDVEFEVNLCNITKTIPVDISVKPGIPVNIQIGQSSSPLEIQSYTALFKEFRDIFAWTYEEMPRIYPSIVVHEIRLPLVPSQSARSSIKDIQGKKQPLRKKFKNFLRLVLFTMFL